VPQAMAQFVLKIELLSHIMGTTPILEMARAYDLLPRLWLLMIIGFNWIRTAVQECKPWEIVLLLSTTDYQSLAIDY